MLLFFIALYSTILIFIAQNQTEWSTTLACLKVVYFSFRQSQCWMYYFWENLYLTFAYICFVWYLCTDCFCRFDLRKGLYICEEIWALKMCLYQTLIVLVWRCVDDITLKSNYYLTCEALCGFNQRKTWKTPRSLRSLQTAFFISPLPEVKISDTETLNRSLGQPFHWKHRAGRVNSFRTGPYGNPCIF